MVKGAPLALLALAGPALAGVINERGGGGGGSPGHWEKPQHWEKPHPEFHHKEPHHEKPHHEKPHHEKPHHSKPHHSKPPHSETPQPPESTVSVTKPHFFTKTTTFTTTDCPGKLSSMWAESIESI